MGSFSTTIMNRISTTARQCNGAPLLSGIRAVPADAEETCDFFGGARGGPQPHALHRKGRTKAARQRAAFSFPSLLLYATLATMANRDAVLELLDRRITPEAYEEIRDLWKRHSIAEDERDLPGLISTLTEDCVYELAGTDHVWHGHEGAARFYTELLTAFPDIDFSLTNIVIGPQGVCEEADVTATHEGAWLDRPATGGPVSFKVVIFFPWDPKARRFAGERVFVENSVTE
jgi:predicted ester cyclase